MGGQGAVGRRGLEIEDKVQFEDKVDWIGGGIPGIKLKRQKKTQKSIQLREISATAVSKKYHSCNYEIQLYGNFVPWYDF